MELNPEEIRWQMLSLLDKTRQHTRALLSSLDPDRVIHTDERAWRVRDILGHLGVWAMEAARSLQAYTEGSEYHCVPSEAGYYDYNGIAVEERNTWTMEQVWAEYESAHDKLKQIVASLPEEKWEGELLYPWNLRGTAEYLIRVMMSHETHEHCDLVAKSM